MEWLIDLNCRLQFDHVAQQDVIDEICVNFAIHTYSFWKGVIFSFWLQLFHWVTKMPFYEVETYRVQT